MSFNPLGVWQPPYRLIQLALWLLLLCIILFTVRNLNNLVEKSVYVYLEDLEAGVPCPLKITLQCSADKKVLEPPDSLWQGSKLFCEF